EDLRFGHRPVRAVARPFGVYSRAGHEFLDWVDGFRSIVNSLMVLAAQDNRFFGTCIDTEPAIDTPHHVDVESGGKFLDLRIWMFARFDIDAFCRTNRRAHVARNAFETSITSNRQDVRSAKTFGIRTSLFRIVDGWRVAFEETREQMPQCDCESPERGPH